MLHNRHLKVTAMKLVRIGSQIDFIAVGFNRRSASQKIRVAP